MLTITVSACNENGWNVENENNVHVGWIYLFGNKVQFRQDAGPTEWLTVEEMVQIAEFMKEVGNPIRNHGHILNAYEQVIQDCVRENFWPAPNIIRLRTLKKWREPMPSPKPNLEELWKIVLNVWEEYRLLDNYEARKLAKKEVCNVEV